jgi:hypothetical protein
MPPVTSLSRPILVVSTYSLIAESLRKTLSIQEPSNDTDAGFVGSDLSRGPLRRAASQRSSFGYADFITRSTPDRGNNEVPLEDRHRHTAPRPPGWIMPPPPRAGGFPITNIRSTSSHHLLAWLSSENHCLVPANSFAEYAPEPSPVTKKTWPGSPSNEACGRHSTPTDEVQTLARTALRLWLLHDGAERADPSQGHALITPRMRSTTFGCACDMG